MTAVETVVETRGAQAPRDQRRPFWTTRRRDELTGYLFIAPQLAGVVLFVLVPVGLGVWYSLNEWNIFRGELTFVGGDNYAALLSDPQLPAVLGATAIFSLGIVVLNIALGLGLAVLLNRRFRGVTFFRTVFFSPVVVSVVAWTLVWGFLLQDNGGINALLAVFGIDGANWLLSGDTAMISVIVTQVIRSVGVNMVLFLAALQGVPSELYEAARIDGAGPGRIFFRITLPLISPTLMLTAVITIVGALQAFANIAVLTGGGPGLSTTVLVYYVFQQAFEFNDIGYGSTLALMLLTFVMLLTLLQWQLRRKWVFYED
ncbi:sn-glycerol-3-phosphate transport system permease protein UgpA [Microbacterium hydrocarbonoxydans]|uniref:sn-glycerol-3-phosphate transport system permease protein UgpA n=1 Tax=Microbacterium hydrocarbonoxydans TaxID=273678 RepID=A0A0M2HVZ2_9MICO|nr:sugar ABC transporter permease [Microbacterium hydrocarbonoxydans]KJL48619.1 sn-glycerol-3-phosphate transport system permease protein UgpA [Microbacterium hydrocarbonoxydans]